MKKKSSELDFLSSLEEGKEVTQQLISKKMDHIADSIYDLGKPIPNSN